jgi:hypothetical protein
MDCIYDVWWNQTGHQKALLHMQWDSGLYWDHFLQKEKACGKINVMLP